MSHFYGTLSGKARSTATRCGTKGSGVQTVAASWAGAVRVSLHVDDKGRDCFSVTQTPWHGHGINAVIAEGVIGEASADTLAVLARAVIEALPTQRGRKAQDAVLALARALEAR